MRFCPWIPASAPALTFSCISNGSLCSDPVILAAANPSPNSIPRTPGMENIACETRDSTESKNGSPRPTVRPVTVHSTIPPTESRSEMALSRTSRQSSESDSLPALTFPCRASSRLTPPTSTRRALILNGHIFFATTPAATIGKVRRPEKCPPPRESLNPSHLALAV